MVIVDGKQVDMATACITNICRDDYPDFCDAYFCDAEFMDGVRLTEEQIEKMNEEYIHIVNEMIHTHQLYR